jgi:hypothetical protein
MIITVLIGSLTLGGSSSIAYSPTTQPPIQVGGCLNISTSAAPSRSFSPRISLSIKSKSELPLASHGDCLSGNFSSVRVRGSTSPRCVKAVALDEGNMLTVVFNLVEDCKVSSSAASLFLITALVLIVFIFHI